MLFADETRSRTHQLHIQADYDDVGLFHGQSGNSSREKENIRGTPGDSGLRWKSAHRIGVGDMMEDGPELDRKKRAVLSHAS